MWTIGLYIIIHVLIFVLCDRCVIDFQFYEFYLFIFFYIDRSLTHYIVLIYFSKLLRLRFLTHYILFTYFSKLLKLIFLSC